MQSRATKRGLVTLYSDLNVGVFPKYLIFAVNGLGISSLLSYNIALTRPRRELCL